jgi:hypothetical protein
MFFMARLHSYTGYVQIGELASKWRLAAAQNERAVLVDGSPLHDTPSAVSPMRMDMMVA